MTNRNFKQWCRRHGLKYSGPQRKRFKITFPKRARPNDDQLYYREVYLKSKHWLELRACKLNEQSSCQECGRLNGLDVHHVNYRSLWDVRLSDLKVLCRHCHILEHRKSKKTIVL